AMIAGAHFLFYSKDPAADRAFFKTVLEFPSVDLGDGWLIFALPPAELAVHPGDGEFVQMHGEHPILGGLLYLMCDDLGSVIGLFAEVREKFKEGETLRAAGRITAHRDMGKSHFLDLRDATGRIQIYIHANEVGAELIDLFRLLDLGDFIGVEGTCFVTKSGESTLKVRTFQLLAKALRSLPEKWHGLQDIEARYRQRYLDLITN